MRRRGRAWQPRVPNHYRKGRRVQDKLLREQGMIVCVYEDGWLLVEWKNGTQGLCGPADVASLPEGR